MVNFTVDQVRNLMENKNNIRNISVIAHVDHGKSTLTDSLVSKAGIIANAKAGEARFTDTREDEQQRSITIKSTSISMYYKYTHENKSEEYLINLIDSPGHVDFSSEVTAALRVTDGALVVVDCVEGVCIQTETVLRQAVSERIRPILFLNKIDRIFIETEIDFEDAYQNFRKIIENVNVIISTYKDMDSDLQLDPLDGKVGFGSGAHAWGFTIRQFAEIYAKQSNVDVDYYNKKFWGDNFYNPKTKKWAKKALTPDHVRGFNHFIMRPIKRFIKAMMESKIKTIDSFAKKMNISMPEDRDMLKEKDLMKAVMRTWLPAGDALLTMIVKHIPSPAEAQRYRYETLYTGDLKDANATAIKECNQDGPLTLFVSKMVPASEKGKFYAFGRVFSGKISSGQRVRILGPNYTSESKNDLHIKNIRNDPLKVGQFGLGFKSVFHITDYVTVVSGRKVLFIDPSEPENKMCRSVALDRLKDIEGFSQDFWSDIWQPFVTKQNLEEGYVPSSLFWFPLRQAPSKVSDTVYCDTRITNLFNSFSVEASNCLTFLHSLENIHLKTALEDGSLKSELEVSLKGYNGSDIGEERRYFRQKLNESAGFPEQELTCRYHVKVTMVREGVVHDQSLCVVHYVPGCQDGDLEWRGDQRPLHTPHVAVAAVLQECSGQQTQGQIFCFLPLPPDEANNCGLPVMVHGFFCLSQNRRVVKWRSEENCTEPDVMWNEELVRVCVTRAYTLLMKWAVQEPSLHLPALLPNLAATRGRWRDVAQALWASLVHLPLVHSWGTGRMETLSSAVSDKMPDGVRTDVAQTLWKVLADLQVPIAAIPDHIQHAATTLGVEVRSISPGLVKSLLSRDTRMLDTWSWEVKIKLLEYLAHDMEVSNVLDLPLLPLENGSWTQFSGSVEHVYICNKDEAAALQGQEHRILNLNISDSLREKLCLIANLGATQLNKFSVQNHLDVLLAGSVNHMKDCSPPREQVLLWLEKVWNLLSGTKLQKIQHLAVMPLSAFPQASELIPLSSIMIQRGPLSREIVTGLSMLGVHVLSDLPCFINHDDLNGFLAKPDEDGVMNVLKKTALTDCDHSIENFNLSCDSEIANSFCTLIGVNRLHERLASMLRRLNIFKALDTNKKEYYTSIEKCNQIHPANFWLPVNLPSSILTPVNEKSKVLAINLYAIEITPQQLFLDSLNSLQNIADVHKLIECLRNNMHLLEDIEIKTRLQHYNFVPTVGKTYASPSNIYDPEDPLKDIFLGEDLLPTPDFYHFLPLLRRLGLKTVQCLTQRTLIDIVKKLKIVEITEDEKKSKIDALLRIINQRPDYKEICQNMNDLPCIYSVRYNLYPGGLQWCSSEHLLKPGQVKSYEIFKDICGSVIPTVNCNHVPMVSEAFGWNKISKFQENYIWKHLDNIIEKFDPNEFKFLDLIKQTYKYLAGNHDSFSDISKPNQAVVFTEHGFKNPSDVYIFNNETDIMLTPYITPLPFDLKEFSQFFVALGCYERQSNEQIINVLHKIKEIHSGKKMESVDRDRHLVVTILEKLHVMTDIDQSQILLPVETEDGRLVLKLIKECTFSNTLCEWLDSEELGVSVVHSCIRPQLAEAFGVEPLNKHLLGDEESFLEWGQFEPLTTRLHNLLRGYSDGLSIFKEMIQNADDAGASTVSFVYDERENEDARSRLISPQLEAFQGPALWVHNDATFSEADFNNLRKLGAGTKKNQPARIGKFGLGFSSVYNLTDLPSFISRSSYVVFDPHLTYLQGKHSHSPGVMYDFSKKRNEIMLKKLKGQFQPFKDLFGCTISETNFFNGTLFRLPLRTPEQAKKSEICNISYGQREVNELLALFVKIVGEVLLFTQNVKEVSMYKLNKHAKSPSEKILLFSSRGEHKLCDDSPVVFNIETPLKSADSLFGSNTCWNETVYKATFIKNISVNISKEYEMGVEPGCWTTTWMVSWHTGFGEACKLAEEQNERALPLAAVAAPLKKDNSVWQFVDLNELPIGFYKQGHLHCFLPLPIRVQLPVQINGCFSITDDRRSLEKKTDDDRVVRKDWNTILMKDSVVAAYHNLLSVIKTEGLDKAVTYHHIWPLASTTHENFVVELVKAFYQNIVDRDLEVFREKENFNSLSNCIFLDNSFLDSNVGKYAFEFMQTNLNQECVEMMRLPDRIKEGFDEENINDYILSPSNFFTNYFLNNINSKYISSEVRKSMLLYILDYLPDVAEIMTNIPCIPTKPYGRLRRPNETVNPNSSVGPLFTIEDERFPEEDFLEINRKASLDSLGMMSIKIPFELIVNRADAIKDISCSKCAAERAFRLLDYIMKQDRNTQENICQKIHDKIILPVMPQPQDWQVKWEGNSDCYLPDISMKNENCKKHNGKLVCFSSPNKMVMPEFMNLVGSINPILFIPEKYMGIHIERNRLLPVLKKLQITTSASDLSVKDVIHQLKEFTLLPQDKHQKIKHKCHDIYSYLNGSKSLHDIQQLQEDKILLTRHGFISPNHFVISQHGNIPPSIFSADIEGLAKYKHLMNTLNIKEYISGKFVFDKLISKAHEHQQNTVSIQELELISKLLGLLFEVWDSTQNLDISKLSLPNSENKLTSVRDLCIDDGEKISSGKFMFLNKKISLSGEQIELLKLKTKSRKRLEQSSVRLKFGQSEPLTTRLKNILNEYPYDSGIMKELLQNADDAGASKIYFIKDFRKLDSKKMYDKSLALLQGPALCVYNDKCFQKEDIIGIQRLGDSNKLLDPACTGQYGIGFNAVYHVTDLPTFLTRSNNSIYEDGDGNTYKETLCLSDPHCKYVPDTSIEFPGAQYIKLDELRQDYPDMFKGYLDGSILKEEGTVFRLPLRTNEDSDISKNVMTPDDLENKLNEFKYEMKMCLLFLKNVRTISVMRVLDDGRVKEEYSVTATLENEDTSKVKTLIEEISTRKSMKTNPNEYLKNLKRISYTMYIKDSQNTCNKWYISQQVGSECDELPEILNEGLKKGEINLLPHGSIAILLDSKDKIPPRPTVSCYLPLPAECHLPFCVNGHFYLNSSRRDLWTGSGDLKTMWNEWVMKNIIVPLSAHGVNAYRLQVFKENEYNFLYGDFLRKQRKYYRMLPKQKYDGKWMKFSNWFYKFVLKQNLNLFDVFIPASDKKEEEHKTNMFNSYLIKKEFSLSNKTPIKLTWHPMKGSSDCFSVSFIEKGKVDFYVENSLKRLGMKICSSDMKTYLENADITVTTVTPIEVLQFIKSWDSSVPDKCCIKVNVPVKDTAFLDVRNVEKVLGIVKEVGPPKKNLSNLPLLVTQDDVLRCFSESEPKYLSIYCDLLPKSNTEFVHRQMLNMLEPILKDGNDLVKPFTLEDLCGKIDLELDPQMKNEEAFIPANIEIKKYVKRFWDFALHCIKQKFEIKNKDTSLSYITPKIYDWKRSKDYILQCVGQWALFPCVISKPTANNQVNSELFTIPINNAWRVFKWNVMNGYHLPTQTLYYDLDLDHLCLTASEDDPRAILKALYHYQDNLPNSEGTKMKILDYLGRNLKKFNDYDFENIKALPLHECINGTRKMISNKKIILPLPTSAIPVESVEQVIKWDILILKPTSSHVLQDLYKGIDSQCMKDDLTIYSEIILPAFKNLNEEDQLKHLEFLNEKLGILNYKEKKYWEKEQICIVNVLHNTPIVNCNGHLQCVNNFFDPTVEVFRVMQMPLLPAEFYPWKWKNFFNLIGMKHIVTPELFLQFINQISSCDNEFKMKSETLVQHFSENIKLYEDYIDEISNTEFIVPYINNDYDKVLSHYRTNSGLVSVSRSFSKSQIDLVWSEASLLPDYAHPLLTTKHGKTHLGASESFDGKFMKHIENLQHGIDNHLFLKVMDRIYRWLDGENGRHLIEQVKINRIPIIHIPDHDIFVTPDLVVIELKTEINPYLFKASRKYGRYFDMFKDLGVSEESNVNIYAGILNCIGKKSKGKRLHEEEMTCIKQAMEGLVSDKSVLGKIETEKLYLPIKDKTLEISTEVLIEDVSGIDEFAITSLNKPVFIGFEEMNIHSIKDIEFAKCLPKHLKPKFLSDMFEEEIQDCLENTELECCQSLKTIKTNLKSENFYAGILRVLNEKKTLSDEEEHDVYCRLNSINLIFLPKVILNLKHNDTLISEIEKPYHVQRKIIDSEMITNIYIKETEDEKDAVIAFLCIVPDIYIDVLECSNDMFNGIKAILAAISLDTNITRSLDVMGIRKPVKEMDHMSTSEVGSYLDQEFIHLLDNSLDSFSEGDILYMKKYLFNDSDDGEDDIFIMVKVVKKDSGCTVFDDKYEVLTGLEHEPTRIVKGHMLYKLINKSGKELVLSQHSESIEEDEDSIMKSVKEQVRIIWKIADAKERRHLLRRLFLKWHPDKNMGREELATRVVQYIQSLVNKLEDGKNIDDEYSFHRSQSNNHQYGSSSFYSFSFSNCYTKSSKFSSSFGHSQGASDFEPSSRTKMPDRCEAKKWLVQAQHDLSTARSTSGVSPCWQCYMCHQGAEKILKAALYLEDRDAAQSYQRGSLCHSLTAPAHHLTAPAQVLARAMDSRVGHHTQMRYPCSTIPCHHYTQGDADFMLDKAGQLFDLLEPQFS